MIIKCKMCGGDIQFNLGDTFGQCEYCGTTSTIPKADDEQKLNRYNRANHFRRQCEFDKAITAYERILEEDDTDAEAHWGIVLSRYGIEYVEDPVTKRRVPTCHRVQLESILADADYLAAIENAPDAESKKLYEEQAKEIAEIQKGILAISANEAPYDVFICYKETDENGERTRDSALAQEVYYGLTEQGYKVFFSRITLEDKLGQEYEPYIFAALNSARVMLVIGTKPECINAVWVKNEWSRYLHLMKNDRKRLIIPCYRNMDPYDLPDELSNLQSQDMSKIGFMQDLIRGVRKVLDSGSDHSHKSESVVQVSSLEANENALLDRAMFALEDGEFDKADEFVEQALNINARNAQAYIYKLMIERKVRSEEKLADEKKELENSPNFAKAMRFGDDTIKGKLTDWSQTVKATVLYETKADILKQSEMDFRQAKSITDYNTIVDKLNNILPFEEANDLKRKCDDRIAELRNNDEKLSRANTRIAHIIEEFRDYEVDVKELQARKHKAECEIERIKKEISEYKHEILRREYKLPNMSKIFESNKRMKTQKEIENLNEKVKKAEERIEENKGIILELDNTDLSSTQERDYQIAKVYYDEGLLEQAIPIWQRIRYYKDADELLNSDEVWPTAYHLLTNCCITKQTVELGKEPGSKEAQTITWIVIASDDIGYLLLSEKALNCLPYSSVIKCGDWDTSEIRNWLNEQFFDEAFSDNEKQIIRLTKTSPSNVVNQTEDRVFILSDEEIQRYLEEKNDSSLLKCEPTAFAINNGAVRYTNLAAGWWWTRTTCSNVSYAKTIDGFGKMSQEFKDKKGGGVRAALWINAYFG